MDHLYTNKDAIAVEFVGGPLDGDRRVIPANSASYEIASLTKPYSQFMMAVDPAGPPPVVARGHYRRRTWGDGKGETLMYWQGWQ